MDHYKFQVKNNSQLLKVQIRGKKSLMTIDPHLHL
jgi:hypothetical protein